MLVINVNNKYKIRFSNKNILFILWAKRYRHKKRGVRKTFSVHMFMHNTIFKIITKYINTFFITENFC